MTSKQVYELSADDLKKVLKSELSELYEDAVLAKYESRTVDASAVCQILDIHRTTLYRYIGGGQIKPIDHIDKADYKFNLRMILEFDMNVKHKSIRTWKNSQNLSKSTFQDSSSHV